MDRRTFVLLSGAASSALLRPGGWSRALRPAQDRPTGRLQFTLDPAFRWTLSYHGDGDPVPLIADAELAVAVGGQLVTLGEMDDTRAIRGIGPEGESLIVSGTTAGIAVDVAFADGLPEATAAITATLSPDLAQGLVEGIRYCALDASAVLAGQGSLRALVNGYHSWDSCIASTVTAETQDTSHGAVGLARGRGGLGMAFDPGEPGEAAVHFAHGAIEARSRWLPVRPLRPEGDAATMRLAYDPAGDPLTALAAVFAPGAVDRDRFSVGAPAGWCSWYEFGDGVTESQVVANLEFCAAHFDRRFLRYVQVDDGYQRAAGDWETNDKFPHGHRWLTDRIHAHGFLAGLWIAPFAVTDRSGIPATHPDWLLMDGGRPLVRWDHASWGGPVYVLDGAHPGVREWLRELARRITHDWGYDYLKIDFLLFATSGSAHHGGATHAEAYRTGLEAIREGLGPQTFLLGCGAPLQHAVGIVNGMRIGRDVDASWNGIQQPARAAALRSFYQRGTWFNDPDCLLVRPPLTLDEARVWASIVAISGGMTLFSDDLTRLPEDRLTILQRAIPAVAVTGSAIDTTDPPPPHAPAIVLDDGDLFPLSGPWTFRTGDDSRYAASDFEEDAWETVPVPAVWERSGHPGYDGVAWYRTRFELPLPSPERMGPPPGASVYLELGRIDDVDATFVNGRKIGETGTPPPHYRSAWDTYRRYAVPAETLNWGGENVLAIRVYDGGGDGGFWSVRGERLPAQWVAAAHPDWWTVALVNWGDDPQDVSVALAALGIDAAHCTLYDVWANVPLPAVTDTLAARIEPHSALVAGLRPIAARPRIIGTTRHIVQGAVDLALEDWDPGSRTLRGKSVNLDDRPYAVTIAVPEGMRAGPCESDPPCTVRELGPGNVVLEWEAGPPGREMEWALHFPLTPTPRGATSTP